MRRWDRLLVACFVLALIAGPRISAAGKKAEPPFDYVEGKAYHILPRTTSDESGYFSLCEGKNGKIYVGTAKYNENAFLVEFDPTTEKQRVVIDTHKVCNLDASGYAAQAKIHTRNYVGRSGTIYVGSKQGYRKKGDTSKYPGGYVMRYDPKKDFAACLGMPYPGQGVIDVVADEKRGLLYVVTCEEQHWMLGDIKGKSYRELGPVLTPYATTLVDSRGRANAITVGFQLAQYEPDTRRIIIRDIMVDGKRFTRANRASIPTWRLSPDRRKAYLILMNDARLIEINLMSKGPVVKATRLGTMVEGKKPDSRSALDLGPKGRVYVVVRVNNDTGFGKRYLHHLARYDPKTGKIEDLGVLAVRNPDFFDFGEKLNDRKPPWSHGFHRLPDGTLTLLYNHMGLIIAHDGTAYVTILYPYTLLRIPPEQLQ
ncbi:MAG: hypothetical protein KGZ25_01065 [Planctomycetes bacterium]|nr:hypothetical protein [Planctomycetota bacterium]